MNDGEEPIEDARIYKNRLEKAMEAGNLAWWEMELPSGEVRFNDRKAKMLGYSPEKFEHYSDFTDLVHPEDYERAMKAMRDHLEGKTPRYEVEYRIKKNNGEYKWFRDVGAISEDKEDSEYKKVTGIVIDIDERKEAEDREDLLHSLLRHDLRNKAQIIQGYLELVRDHQLPDQALSHLEKAEKGVEESIDLIEKVRHLRKAQEEEIKIVKIEPIISEAIDRSSNMFEDKGIEIEVESPEKDFKIKAGPLLTEVIYNILENAAHHSDADKVSITLKKSDQEIICTIEDDGKGIPDDEKEKIFDKGFTTDKNRGTGLGMFLAKTLLEIYGATIEVKNSELGGTQFEIRLEKA